MMTDPIADMLTRIRNANSIKREIVDIPASKIKMSIAEILADKGYINSFARIDDGKQGVIRVALKYSGSGENVIHTLKRVSVPSRRKYLTVKDIKDTCGGMGISILTTSQGVMTADEAKRRNVGGEIICEIW